MATLSQAASKAIAVALANNVVAPEVIQAVADARAVADQGAVIIAATIVATSVSQTTDFGALLENDIVLVIAASAGNAHFVEIATAGDLGEAAVVGSLYVVLRAASLPAAADVAPIF